MKTLLSVICALLINVCAADTLTITQKGNGNTANVIQSGIDNKADLFQQGSENFISLYQESNSNYAAISQKGSHHVADVRQLHDSSRVIIDQAGKDHGVKVITNSDLMTVKVHQR